MGPVDALVRRLTEFGYLKIDGLIGRERAELVEGVVKQAMLDCVPFSGPEVRIRGLLNNLSQPSAGLVEELLLNPVLLAISDQVLGPDCRLAEVGARLIRPGAPGLPLHVGAPADRWVSITGPITATCLVLTFSWVLSDITLENGVRFFAPFSHHYGHGPRSDTGDESLVCLTAEAGSLIMFNSAVWHGFGPSAPDSTDRLEIASAYCVPWIDPNEIGWNLIDPHRLRLLSPEIQHRQTGRRNSSPTAFSP